MAADPDGTNLRQLTTALPHANEGVEVAPDGSRLVAVSKDSTPATLEVMPLDGSNRKTVLDLGGIVPTDHPRWRPPDADEIVFLGHPGGVNTDLALYRIRPDGSGLTKLASSRVQAVPDQPRSWSRSRTSSCRTTAAGPATRTGSRALSATASSTSSISKRVPTGG